MKKTILSLILSITALVFVLGIYSTETSFDAVFTNSVTVEDVLIEDEAVALSSTPNTASYSPEEKSAPSATGIKEKKSSKTLIDYSNTSDGYIMVKFIKPTEKRIKAQVKGPSSVYTYNITPEEFQVLPLTDSNGKYQVSVFENVTDNKYALVSSVSFDVQLKDEFAPFLNSNQFVDYTSSLHTAEKASEITKDIAEPIKKVEAVYDWVVANISYDKEKAANVKSGYLPVLDNVLAEKKGICFDYASLMTGMLRSQNIPCKLVVGYAGTSYHAWISVWTHETGWIDGIIYFDGDTWHRMDPTFASTGQKSEEVMKYIGNGTNYTAKYFY